MTRPERIDLERFRPVRVLPQTIDPVSGGRPHAERTGVGEKKTQRQ